MWLLFQAFGGALQRLAGAAEFLQRAAQLVLQLGFRSQAATAVAEQGVGLLQRLTQAGGGLADLAEGGVEFAAAALGRGEQRWQLGIQALSIANQQPQNLLSLFR